MSEKLPPQNNDSNDHEKDGRAEKVPKIIEKYQKKLEAATSDEEREKIKKKIDDLNHNLEYDSDPSSFGNRNPVEPSESVPSIDNIDVEDYEHESTPLTPAEKKYALMQSDEAQQAFISGGNDAYVQFIEDGFKAIDDSYSKELQTQNIESFTPGKELQTQSVEHYNGVETDIYGNPVHHEREWSRNPDTEPTFTPYGELPQSGTQQEEYSDKEQLAIEAKKPEFLAAKESYEEFIVARDKYAELTSRDRKSYFIGRYTKDPRSFTGKLLYKFPGIKQLSEKIIGSANTKQGRQIEEAKIAYEDAVIQLEYELEDHLKEQDKSENEIMIAKAIYNGQLDEDFQKKLVTQQHSDSRKTNKAVDWWVNQPNNWKGKAKKAGVVFAAGAGAGTAVALAAPVWLASLAGGAAGAGIAHYVTKRRANAIVETADGTKVTLAEKQSLEDTKAKNDVINQYTADIAEGKRDNELHIEELTEVTENRSNKEAFENRSRLRKAFVIGKLGGLGAGLSVEGIKNLLDNDTPYPADTPPTPEPESQPPAAPPAPEAPTLNGETFTVEYGSGYTNELMQFAQANGHNLSPSQAFQLHEHLMSKFGADYININGPGNDIYTQAGDVRLSTPGNAEWVKGVTGEAQKWMAGKGLW